MFLHRDKPGVSGIHRESTRTLPGLLGDLQGMAPAVGFIVLITTPRYADANPHTGLGLSDPMILQLIQHFAEWQGGYYLGQEASGIMSESVYFISRVGHVWTH